MIYDKDRYSCDEAYLGSLTWDELVRESHLACGRLRPADLDKVYHEMFLRKGVIH